MGEAVQIVSFRDGRIRINIQDFAPILEKIGHKPVSLVSVNGPMRTGKSYILGHFLRYLATSGEGDWFNHKLDRQFHWKSSAERQTTGILVWSEPFLVEQDGREVAVLLMDTQGCFDDKTTSNENSHIFAISCLLSSVLVYNVSRQISEDVLQFLQLFIGYAKIPLEAGEAEPFSKLVFLIRDWQNPIDYGFGYYDDHKDVNRKNFKREKFDVNDGMVKEVQIVHGEISSSFHSVGCCLMPHPGKGLAYYDRSTDLDEDFMETIQDFVPRLFSPENVVVKLIGGKEVTGKDLKKIVKTWDELFSRTKIPEVKTVAEATAEAQYTISSSIAYKGYKKDMSVVKTGNGIDDDQLKKMHKSKLKEAIAMFENMKQIENSAIKGKFLKDLTKKIKAAFESYQEINGLVRKFNALEVKSEEDRKSLKKQIQEIERRQQVRIFATVGEYLDAGVSAVVDVVEATGDVVVSATTAMAKYLGFME